MFNTVVLIGNLTRNPELKYLPSGKVVGNFGIATNRNYGEDKQETFFGEITIWGKMAEVCHEYLRKGSKILVEGRLTTEQFEYHGEKRQKTRIIAENIRFLDRKKESAGDEMAPEKITEPEPF